MTAASGKRPALILFAHGSRDPQWAEPFVRIRERVAQSRPDTRVELAYLELMEPRLPQVIDALAASGHTRLTVAPLFMAQGAHTRRDLVEIVDGARARHPALEIALLPPAGEAQPVLDAIATWVSTHA